MNTDAGRSLNVDQTVPPIYYYNILGVAPTATTDEIKAAYRARIAHYHPDRNPSIHANAVTALVNEAWEVLGDPERRRQYDATMGVTGWSGPGEAQPDGNASTHTPTIADRHLRWLSFASLIFAFGLVEFTDIDRPVFIVGAVSVFALVVIAAFCFYSVIATSVRGWARAAGQWLQFASRATPKVYRLVMWAVFIGMSFLLGMLAAQKRGPLVPATTESSVKASSATAPDVLSARPRSESSWVGSLHNDRLKAVTLGEKIDFLPGTEFFALVEGIWMPESKDPAKALAFVQQVRIHCYNDSPPPESTMALSRQRLALELSGPRERECVETALTLVPENGMSVVPSIDTLDYDIDSWDRRGLIAHGGGDAGAPCVRRVLTMDFESGAVSVSDIPTHKKGCEAFTETNSYRLVRGFYYVDTTPNNDLDKPAKVGNKGGESR